VLSGGHPPGIEFDKKQSNSIPDLRPLFDSDKTARQIAGPDNLAIYLFFIKLACLKSTFSNYAKTSA